MKPDCVKKGNVVEIDCSAPYRSSEDDGSVIHRQLLNRLTNEIVEAVYRIKHAENKEEWRQGMPRLNYFIAGPRGSGKSTFLRHLTDNLTIQNRVRMRELCWYDPSESIGLREDFFITVVAAVKTCLEIEGRNADRHKAEDSRYLNLCMNYMRKLDKAIVRLSQERRPLSNLSEHHAYMLRLNDPEMNGMVRENFAKCMENLCHLCGVDSFILEIDDIDTRTEQCFNVLECLRLYMGNPYVVVLMAGDKALNIERIRESHFGEFNYRYHESDEQGRKNRMRSVMTHAAQYFAKLFPVKRQYELQNLHVLGTKHIPITIRLKYAPVTQKSESVLFREWLIELFRSAISPKESEVLFYVQFFLSLPLRQVTQILDYWINSKLWESMVMYAILVNKGRKDASHVYNAERIKKIPEEWIEKANSELGENFPTSKSLSDAQKKQLIGELKRNIEYHVQVAITRALTDLLPPAQYNYESLNTSDGRAYYALMLQLCQNMGDLEHGYYLTDEGNTGDKMLMLLLAVNFRKRIKSLKGFLEYMLYGPASITLYGKALEQFKSENNNPVLKTEQDLRKSFAEYMHVGNWRSASRWARHANMIWGHDQDNNHVHSGIFRISNNEAANAIQEILNKMAESDDDCKKAVALMVSMNRADGRDNSYFVSIYSFLAYILRCIEICDKHRGNSAEIKRELKEMTKGYLCIKSCRRPEWQLKINGTDAGNNNTIRIDVNKFSQNTYLDTLMGDIDNWYKRLTNNQKAVIDDISPRRMGTIWSDFYYAIRTECHALSGGKKENDSLDVKDVLVKIKNFVYQFFSHKDSGNITESYCDRISDFPLIENKSTNKKEKPKTAKSAKEVKKSRNNKTTSRK